MFAADNQGQDDYKKILKMQSCFHMERFNSNLTVQIRSAVCSANVVADVVQGVHKNTPQY